MRDSREYHMLTWLLILTVALVVIKDPAARVTVTIAWVMVAVMLLRLLVSRWRGRRGRR